MDHRTITALMSRISGDVDLGKARLWTLCLLILGIVSARTVNLTHLACERGGAVQTASTYRRLQRFFQHVCLPEDWSAGLLARLVGVGGPWTLCLDRTNWQIGATPVNVLVLALCSRRHRVPLMWTVLGWRGNSGAPERIALIQRFCARFGKARIRVLLADREFIGADWVNWLIQNDIPFVIRMREGMYASPERGIERKLVHLFANPRTQGFAPGRHQASLRDLPDRPLTFEARQIPGGDRLIVATNRPGLHALAEYRKRWAIECLFGDLKTRGFNLEDTRLRDPRKLSLLIALAALAAAWASRTAEKLLASRDIPRKTHGYPAKSRFRKGFDHLRSRLRTNNSDALASWPMPPQNQRVV